MCDERVSTVLLFLFPPQGLRTPARQAQSSVQYVMRSRTPAQLPIERTGTAARMVYGQLRILWLFSQEDLSVDRSSAHPALPQIQ